MATGYSSCNIRKAAGTYLLCKSLKSVHIIKCIIDVSRQTAASDLAAQHHHGQGVHPSITKDACNRKHALSNSYVTKTILYEKGGEGKSRSPIFSPFVAYTMFVCLI